MFEIDSDIENDSKFQNCTYTGNNCIISEWKQKEFLVKFIIEYGLLTLQSNRCEHILTIIPATWTERCINVKDAIKILNILTDLEKIFYYLAVASDDESLIKLIGVETYGFIKFLLHMNTAIYIEKIKLFLQDDIRQNSRINQYKMTYMPEIESNFKSCDKSKNTLFLFHGTPAVNIIPILATGIRNCSANDVLRLNGAVHGEGIYLSDSAEFALSYCKTAFSNGNSTLAMLVYEVIDNPKWFRAKNIYVVNDETALILRYVIIISSYDSIKDYCIFPKLTEIFKSGRLQKNEQKKEIEKQSVLSKAYNKRLMIEYKQLIKKNMSELGFSIKLAEEDNLRVWIICIPTTSLENPNLASQMEKLTIPFLELEISFPESYPIEPPFPRVIYPRFQSLTGHITTGGSICMESISRSGWAPTTNIESLITQIKIVLSEGDAKIDELCYNLRYNLKEAKETFTRAMQTHGWT